MRLLIQVASTGQLAVDWAIQKKAKDFEDAVQYFAALHYGVDVIISRNVRDYPYSDIPVITPLEFLASMGVE
ncbi:MAG: hypothetical protein MJZ61_04070 [Bacteroidales bacterium]|nr:hypothetical protein [Bacteroidales bacterium]